MRRSLTAEHDQFVEPAGAYFIFVDISSIEIPTTYQFPEPFASRSQDFKVCYYLTNELGVTSIPGSCELLFSLSSNPNARDEIWPKKTH